MYTQVWIQKDQSTVQWPCPEGSCAEGQVQIVQVRAIVALVPEVVSPMIWDMVNLAFGLPCLGNDEEVEV